MLRKIVKIFLAKDEGKIDRSAPEWTALSPEAKDLVEALLRVDPAERIGVEEALQHDFIRKHVASASQHDDVLAASAACADGRRFSSASARTLISSMRRRVSSSRAWKAGSPPRAARDAAASTSAPRVCRGLSADGRAGDFPFSIFLSLGVTSDISVLDRALLAP